MKKRIVKLLNLTLVVVLASSFVMQADASTIGEIKSEIEQNENALKEINDEMIELQDKQDLIEEEISDLDAELLNTMAAIGVLEEEIVDKEESIQVKEADIATAQAFYDEAQAKQQEQYDALVTHIQFIYERGETNYLDILFSAENFGQLLSQADYVEALYEYEQKLIDEYEETSNQLKLMWDQLELEKAALEAEKSSLEADKASMEEQKVYMDGLLAEKKKEAANFEASISRVKQEANVLKTKIKQEKAELTKLQEEERRNNAANGNYSVSTSVADIISSASGSDLGKQIARYGCQFIGNPYVSGGTSLTNGADCSGFTYRIYKDFGYTIPRTSFLQRSAGTEVSYSNAQPGDLICYNGHVALYIGGGYIVHASSTKTGIKLSKATYKTILSVRRII